MQHFVIYTEFRSFVFFLVFWKLGQFSGIGNICEFMYFGIFLWTLSYLPLTHAILNDSLAQVQVLPLA